MCLAVPLTITEIRPGGSEAVAERDGVRRIIDISFLKEPEIGDRVLVHAGFAIERLGIQQAEDIVSSYNELMQELESIRNNAGADNVKYTDSVPAGGISSANGMDHD